MGVHIYSLRATLNGFGIKSLSQSLSVFLSSQLLGIPLLLLHPEWEGSILLRVRESSFSKQPQFWTPRASAANVLISVFLVMGTTVIHGFR